ncbi:MAG: hypothetical protein AB1679_16150 [Actinomycetota bacterium]|jgi:hypothetical protein
MLLGITFLGLLALLGAIAGTVMTGSANFLIASLALVVVFVTALALAVDAGRAALGETRNDRAGARGHEPLD